MAEVTIEPALVPITRLLEDPRLPMTKLALLERLPPLTMSELFDELLLSPMIVLLA